LLTDRQTDRQTDKQTNKVWQKHYLLDGGNYPGVIDSISSDDDVFTAR